mmetsp:Transcript_89259/g.139713  ORF Transcript_89259/g.139713 Transcript_89259/m.139713 type:complete len:333 (+) Transcript_89259:47-1045(+)
MPTDEEHQLFQRMTGGSGNENLDAHIAQHLQRVVNVPAREITSFVRTRDRNSVQKLKAVLKEMPRGRTMTSGGSPSVPRDFASGEAAKRVKDLACATKSLYGHSFGSADGQPAKRTTSHAFDGIIRKSFQPHLESWWREADENQVRVLADTCRALRVFVSTQGAPTTYKDDFPRYIDARPSPPFDKQAQASSVPLGGLNDDTAYQKESRARRDRLEEDSLTSAIKLQTEARSGKYAKWKTPICCAPPPANANNALACLKDGQSDANNWKSESRATYLNDVHSTRQKMRYAVTLPQKGNLAWKECAATPRKRAIPTSVLNGRSLSAPMLAMNI